MDLSLRSIRKNIAALSVFALIASMLVVTNVANAAAVDVYDDVTGGEWYEADVNWGLDNGVLDDTQAYFRAGDDASRAEFFTMVARGAAIPETACDETLFPDLSEDHWGCGYLTAMADAGIISGDGAGSENPGFVRPDDPIRRAETAKVVVEAYGLTGTILGSDVFTDVELGAWFDSYMGIANENCVFQGVDNGNTAEPARRINRAESVVVVSRGANPPTDCAPVVEAGALTVAVDGSSPDTVSIPQNGANIPYSVFNFAASADEAVHVEQVVITREGLGLPGDFTNLKIYVDGVQKGSEKTISTSTNTATFNLSSDPIEVPAGSSVLVEVRADMSGVSGSQNQLCIASGDDVLGYGADSAGEVSVGGTFAACGNYMETTSASVGTLTYDVSQPSTADIDVGETDATMTKVKMDMATEDAEVERVTFKQTGSAGMEDFGNVSLWMSGSMYADNPSWEGDFVTFDLSEDPIFIAKGNSKTVELHTDVVGGLASTANFDIYRDWHIEGTGQVYGYGVNVVEAGTSSTPTARNIIGGNVAFSLSSNNPVTGDVKQGAGDHEFTRFNVSTGGDGVTVRKLSLTVTSPGDPTLAEIDDMKIWTKNSSDEWYVVAGPNDLTAATSPETASFTDTFDIPAATTQEFMVTADVSNAATAGWTYDIDVADVTVAVNTELEYLSDGTPLDVTADVTGGLLNGNVMTVNTPQLTVSLAATPGDKEYVRNTTEKDLVAFDMNASTADDLRVTGMTVTCSDTDEATVTPNDGADDDLDGIADEGDGVDNDGDGTIDNGSAPSDPVRGNCATAFQSLYLYEKDGSTLTELDGPRSVSDAGAGDGTVTFSFNKTVDAGSTGRFLVRGNLASSANQDGYLFNVNSVTAEDTDSSSANITPGLPLAGSRKVIVAAQGTMTNQNVTDTDLKARIVTSLAEDEPALKVRFDTSELEAWYVKKMQFDLDGSCDLAAWDGAADPCADAGVSSIYVNYLDNNGDPQVVSGTISNGTVTFEGLDAYIPAGGSQTVEVSLNMGEVSTGGASAGDLVQLTFNGAGTFEAIGAASATSVTAATSVTSKSLRLAKSYPVVARNEISTALADGEVSVYEATIAADDTADIAIKQLYFDVGLTGVGMTASNAKLFKDGNLISDSADIDLVDAAGVDVETGGVTTEVIAQWNDATGAGEDVISAGTSATYTLKLTVSGASGTGYSVSTSLRYDSAAGNGAISAPTAGLDMLNTFTGGALADQGFVWSDLSFSPHSNVIGTSSPDYLNGYLVQGLSSAGSQILSK